MPAGCRRWFAARICAATCTAHTLASDGHDSLYDMARDEGVLVAINTDAHSIHDFANLTYGVGQARRGWLEAKDVLNTRPLAQLMALFRR